MLQRSVIAVLLAALLSLRAATARAADAPTTRPLPALPNTNVSIPWNELLPLLARAGASEHAAVDFVFSPAAYKAVVEGQTVRVAVDVDVTVLAEGNVLVPIGPADAGVLSANVGAEPAAVVLNDRALFVLLAGKGKKHLTLTLERPVQADGGATRFDLPLLPSPLVTLTTTIPAAGLDARALRASSLKVTEAANATTAVASYAGGSSATVSWSQRPAGAKREPRVYAETDSLVTVERGLLRTRARVRLRIERAAVPRVTLWADAKAVLLSVTGKGVSGFAEVAAKDAGGRDVKSIAVDFAEPAEGDREIEVVYERDLPEAGGAVAISPLVVNDARRDGGIVAVETRGGYELRPGDSTMERIGVSELPEATRSAAKGTLQVAYRYAGQPATAGVVLERAVARPAKVFALTQTRVAVDRGVLRCRAAITYEILHAGVDALRLGLPAGVELIAASGTGVRGTQVVEEKGGRILIVGLKDLAKGSYSLTVDYDAPFAEAGAANAPAAGGPTSRPATAPATVAAGVPSAASIPLLTHPDAAQDRGFVGVEVRGGYEVTPAVTGAERIDVKEPPRALWELARSPLMLGYRYDAAAKPALGLSLVRHRDADVLVAMSDVCEATTTFTPDGKGVTKMMFVVRNNLKPFLTLRMPEGAQVWSTFVDDRPVTPSLGAGGALLIPLRKSEDVDEDDDKSYRAQRDQRREEGADGERHVRRLQQAQKLRDVDDLAKDLKPYDVEVVFVMPAVKFAPRGELVASLPQSDVPIGHLAWAVFLPKDLRVAYSEGNAAEVSRFTLPFRHFGDVGYARMKQMADKMAKAEAMAQAQQELAKAADAAEKLAEAAKAQGVLPVRIEIPIVGEIYRYEKFLVVDEAPKVTMAYVRKAAE